MCYLQCFQDFSYSSSSLVDRGANGEVAGNDVRIIEKHPDKTVKIRGIDNHEVPYTPIVTAGGVTDAKR